LLLKGTSLLVEAQVLRPEGDWPRVAAVTGLVVGGLKALLLFSRSCRKNLARIDALNPPRIWQFFRPGFFLALAAMITLGATLSRMAHGSYPFLIGVGILDLAIGVALLVSSIVFWKEKAFLSSTP
jgi:hypothetical protein